MKTGIELISEERSRQVTQERWTPEHDDEHTLGELAMAGACYASLGAAISRAHLDFKPSEIYPPKLDNLEWPWDAKWWKPSDDPIRNLIKSGALIAAEIDRLQRLLVVKG
jgi:hypothetical protein